MVRFTQHRGVRCLFALATLATAAALLSACSLGGDKQDVSRDREAEQAVQASLNGGVSMRYTNVRCVEAPADSGRWTHLCTFQIVGLGLVRDQPLVVMGYRIEGDQARLSSGIVPLDVTCAEAVECWRSNLCFATHDCPYGEDDFFGEPQASIPQPVTPRPTVSSCIAAWNAHGGFAPAEIEQEPPPHASTEVARPVYAPHLSGASLGFIARRAEVHSAGNSCVVTFDVGPHGLYRVRAQASGETRFWMWRGADDFEVAAARAPVWNACQREDGRLFRADDCPHAAAIPRSIGDELERGHLASISEIGGIPYWLGRSFQGAAPVGLDPSRGAESVVEYRIQRESAPVTLRIYTYRPPRRSLVVKGKLVARAEPEDATAVVVATGRVSDHLRHAVQASLRPYISTNPDAPQVPGDVHEEPTRIDTSVPVRLLWVGPSFEGFTANVVGDAPEGAGVVRYAKGGDEWFLVTYTPRKKKHCAQIGCVSPPPLPAALAGYGQVVHTLLADRLTVVLSRRPGIVPNSTKLFEELRPVE